MLSLPLPVPVPTPPPPPAPAPVEPPLLQPPAPPPPPPTLEEMIEKASPRNVIAALHALQQRLDEIGLDRVDMTSLRLSIDWAPKAKR